MRAIALLAILPLLHAAPASNKERGVHIGIGIPPLRRPASHVHNGRNIPHASVAAGKRMVRRKVSRTCPPPSSSLSSIFTSAAPTNTSSQSTEHSSTGTEASATPPPSSSTESSTTSQAPSSSTSTPVSPTSMQPSLTSSDAPSSQSSTGPPITSPPPISSTESTPPPTTQPPTSTPTPDPTTSFTPIPSTFPDFNEDEYECLEWCEEDDDNCVPEYVTDGPTPSTWTSSVVPTPTPTGPITVDRDGAGPFSGQGTWFGVGLSACGTYDTDTMPVVAISHELFDSWPGYNGYNPNTNPVCNKHIRVTYKSKSVVVQVTDRCPGCDERSLDLSPSAFEQLAPLGLGRLVDGYTQNIKWSWVQGEGRLPELPLNGSLAWPGLD